MTTAFRHLRPVLGFFFAERRSALLGGALLAAVTVLAGAALLGLSGWFIAATAIAGLSSALDFVVETGVETIAAHEAALASRFVDQVASIDGVTVYGDVLVPDHGRRTATVSINVRDYDSAAVSDALSQTYDIATRPGAHCAPRMHESMGTTDRGTVRFSFGWFNTGEDADEAVAAVREIAS